MIRVGINENVVLTKVELTEKKNLQFTFREKGKGTTQEFDPFAALNQGNVIDNASDTSIQILSVLPMKEADAKQAPVDRSKRVEITTKRLNEMLNKLKHLLSPYLLTADIAKVFTSIYEGTGFNAEVYRQNKDSYGDTLLTPEKMELICVNAFNAFIGAITPHLDSDDKAVRLKLVRQSKEKHYGTFPSGMYLESEPFIESMSIPAAATKVKFSTYEISQGLNNPEPIAQSSSADATPTTSAPPANPFGSR